jgi:polyketide synthase-associated protein
LFESGVDRMTITGISVLKKPVYGEIPSNDVQPGKAGDFGSDIVDCLRMKGYCILSDLISEEGVALARADVHALGAARKLQRPSSLIQEGLLGPDGSSRIVMMQPTDLDGGEAAQALDGHGLRDVDLLMWALGKVIEPHQESIGMNCGARSPGVVHHTGVLETDDVDGDVELNDEEATRWLPIFVRQKILALVFLGPSHGSLELRPYDDDAHPFELTLTPGVAMLVRTDQLAFRLNLRDGMDAATVTCSFLQDDIMRMHKVQRQAHMTPVSLELEKWVESRILELSTIRDDEDDATWDVSIPRAYVVAMNHNFTSRQQVAVRGMCGRLPSDWNAENLFLALNAAPDLVVEVPFQRWDHSTIYDEAEDCWRQDPPKTNCKHASFIEGVDLFDNKMFGLSAAEAKSMDPAQRQILEVSYEVLHKSGMRKNTMMNSNCGVFVGVGASEWIFAERGFDLGSFEATSVSSCITAGRVSFSLGLKGACLAIDTEAAASLNAVYWATEGVQSKGRGQVHEQSIALGVHLAVAKKWWPSMSAAGFLNPAGRCFTFDASARGYVRGEGCAGIVVRPLEGKSVDEDSYDDDLPLDGMIAGGAINNSGRTAGMNAPSGPAEQQVLAESCRKAGITVLDIDAVECHGAGSMLADAVEVASCVHALRNVVDARNEPLILSSVKTSLGNGVEVAGVTALIKMLYTLKWGFLPGNLHLRELNPHIAEMEDAPVQMNSESISYRLRSAFCGVSGRGFGGNNVNIICHGSADEERRPLPQPLPEERRARIAYWPAGGGHLDARSRPKKGYSLVGTWDSWSAPAEMEKEADDRYGATIVIGKNLWEQFRILIDGDSKKVLHPRENAAPKGTTVFGPELPSVASEYAWFVDARACLSQEQLDFDIGGDSADPSDAGADGPSAVRSRQGVSIRVLLHVTGKYRTVTWFPVEEQTSSLDK